MKAKSANNSDKSDNRIPDIEDTLKSIIKQIDSVVASRNRESTADQFSALNLQISGYK